MRKTPTRAKITFSRGLDEHIFHYFGCIPHVDINNLYVSEFWTLEWSQLIHILRII